MQRLEVSCAVRDIYIYNVSRLRVNMNLVISKCVTAVILSNFSGHYLRNRSTLDIGVLGYIGIF